MAEVFKQTITNKIHIVGHNLKFDIHWLDNLGIEHGRKYFDTMFPGYVQLEGRIKAGSLTLETLSGRKQELGNLLVHEYKLNPAELSPELVLQYCYDDVLATEKLYLEQISWLREVYKKCYTGQYKRNQYWAPVKLMNDLLPILIDCERNGFNVDKTELEKIYVEQQAKRDALVKEVADYIKAQYGVEEFNLNSPVQVSKFIYSLELKKEKKLIWKRFFANFNSFEKNGEELFQTMLQECFAPTGYGLGITPLVACLGEASLSVGVDPLKLLIRANENHKEIDLLKKFYEISRLDTLIGTFIEAILGCPAKGKKKAKIRKIVEENGKWILHTQYNQIVTATGRLSSSNPNLQNWPREGKFPVKSCVRSRFAGGKILDADASQIELRYGGWYFKDAQLKADYERGIDIHSEVTTTAYGTTKSDACFEEQRSGTKSTVFRLWYRGTAGSIAADPKIPIWDKAEAQKVIDSIYNRYTGVRDGHKADEARVKNSPDISMVTPTGRVYSFKQYKISDTGPEYKRWHFSLKNKIANYPIQSGATADLIPCAMIVIDRLMHRLQLKSLTMGNVHDSIVFDVYPGEEKILVKICEYALTRGCKIEWKRRFGMEFDFPLGWGHKLKEHW